MKPMSDHYAEATRLIDGLHNLEGHNADFDMALAQVHATLALAEQQRIANLIALAGMTFPDGRTYLTHLVTDPLEYSGVKAKPEIARALRIETK